MGEWHPQEWVCSIHSMALNRILVYSLVLTQFDYLNLHSNGQVAFKNSIVSRVYFQLYENFTTLSLKDLIWFQYIVTLTILYFADLGNLLFTHSWLEVFSVDRRFCSKLNHAFSTLNSFWGFYAFHSQFGLLMDERNQLVQISPVIVLAIMLQG